MLDCICISNSEKISAYEFGSLVIGLIEADFSASIGGLGILIGDFPGRRRRSGVRGWRVGAWDVAFT